MSLSGKKRVREIVANLVAEAWDVENKSKELRFDTRDEGDNVSLVSVALPASLVQRYTKKKRITFMNFMNDNLFPQEVDQTKRFINSKIVSASVKVREIDTMEIILDVCNLCRIISSQLDKKRKLKLALY